MKSLRWVVRDDFIKTGKETRWVDEEKRRSRGDETVWVAASPEAGRWMNSL